MLSLLNKLAERLRPWRWSFWLVLASGVAGFVASVAGIGELSDGAAMVFLTMVLWSLSLLVIAACFPRRVEVISASDGFVVRLKKRLRYAFTWLIGAVTVLVTVTAVWTGIRLVGVFMGP